MYIIIKMASIEQKVGKRVEVKSQVEETGDPFIKIYRHAVPATLCESLIAMMDESRDSHSQVRQNGASCNKFEFPTDTYPDTHSQYCQLRLIIKALFENYKSITPHYSNFNWIKQIAPPNIAEYRKDVDSWGPHCDAWNAESMNRILNVTIYLNDVKEGGETALPNQGISIAPQMGTVVIYPSGMTYPYKEEMPKSCTKYIVTTWLCVPGVAGSKFYLSNPL